MSKNIKTLLVGDAMIKDDKFVMNWEKYMQEYGNDYIAGMYEADFPSLQKKRLVVEHEGPEQEPACDFFKENGKDAEMALALFAPFNKEALSYMPNLKIAGVCRDGTQNVNIEECTKRGILVFNVRGRNAHAVSDFTVGMMLAEARNIGRAHAALKSGDFRKNFSNAGMVPDFQDRTVGLVGFGYIGSLVARKLSGFQVKVLVYDPFVDKALIESYPGCQKVDDIMDVMKNSDFISIHTKATEKTKNLVGEKEIAAMKPSAYLINTARATIVDQHALYNALKEKRIAGAALDVFMAEGTGFFDKETQEGRDSMMFCELDNVTITTHIAGSTDDVFTNSPGLLMNDIKKLLKGEQASFIKNPEVLENPEFKAWLESKK